MTKTSYGQTGAALAEPRGVVTGPVAQRALGPDVTAALTELMDASGWVAAAREPDGGARESERFYNGANTLAATEHATRMKNCCGVSMTLREIS